MVTVPLHDFVAAHRSELILRARALSASRSARLPTTPDFDDGIPIFLYELVNELRQGSSHVGGIGQSAGDLGHNLFVEGFTIDEVVHGYGDICQAITGLAIELDARISTEDFRSLNACLDDAIASAVAQYTQSSASSSGYVAPPELRDLVQSAITTFGVLQAGTVAAAGRTGEVLRRTLHSILAIVETPAALPDNNREARLSHAPPDTERTAAGRRSPA